MKLILLLLIILVLNSEIFEATPLTKSQSIGKESVNSLNGSSSIEADDERDGRSSPVGSIAGYLTNYQEKKRLKLKKQHHSKNPASNQKSQHAQYYTKNPVSNQKPQHDEEYYTKKPVYHPKTTKGSYYQKNQKHCFYGHIFVRC